MGEIDPDFGSLSQGSQTHPWFKSPEILVKTWTLVYAANLPVALWMSVPFMPILGKFGILAGLVTLYLAGYRACYSHPEAVDWLCLGAKIVALTQICPVLQLAAGMIGVAGAQNSRWGRFGEGHVLDGFLATVFTGGLLILASSALGLLFYAVNRMTQPRIDPDRSAKQGRRHPDPEL